MLGKCFQGLWETKTSSCSCIHPPQASTCSFVALQFFGKKITVPKKNIYAANGLEGGVSGSGICPKVSFAYFKGVRRKLVCKICAGYFWIKKFHWDKFAKKNIINSKTSFFTDEKLFELFCIKNDFPITLQNVALI